MITFNCNEITENNCPLTVGKKYVLCDDVYYSSLSDIEDIETAEWFSTFATLKNDLVYIPQGIIIEFKGFSANGWPTFGIAGDELDFASDEDITVVELKQ